MATHECTHCLERTNRNATIAEGGLVFRLSECQGIGTKGAHNWIAIAPAGK